MYSCLFLLLLLLVQFGTRLRNIIALLIHEVKQLHEQRGNVLSHLPQNVCIRVETINQLVHQQTLISNSYDN